jgi:hypothetical protein
MKAPPWGAATEPATLAYTVWYSSRFDAAEAPPFPFSGCMGEGGPAPPARGSARRAPWCRKREPPSASAKPSKSLSARGGRLKQSLVPFADPFPGRSQRLPLAGIDGAGDPPQEEDLDGAPRFFSAR